MKSSKTLSGLVTAALAASAIALSAPTASAALPFDPTFTPATTDLVGVGSDTTEISMHYLAEGVEGIPGFNEGRSTGRIASFQAGGGGEITIPGGTTISRPNGSGAGKGRLYGANNLPEIDFARSSSGLNDAERAAGLQNFPFAVDGLKLAVSNSVASHAPASISAADMVRIYEGSVTNWSEIGGQPGVIKPLIPQAGSGTRSFFVSQLQAANGGVAVTLGTAVEEVQEHDPAPVQSDPNAVAPFSTGRAAAAGPVIKLTDGFAANRALYNVVRGADVGRADLLAAFGPDGFLCSDAAAPLIEAAGFFQLAREANGGACGVPTQSSTSNFTVNEVAETTTELAATSPSAGRVSLVATVSSAAGTPSGTVTFTEGSTVVAADVPIVQGRATATLDGVTPGARTYTATLNPGDGFLASSDDATVTVSDRVDITAKAKPVAKGKTAKIQVTISGATGEVTLLKGAKEIDSATLSSGKATLLAKKVKKNTRYTVAFGDQTVTVLVKIKK